MLFLDVNTIINGRKQMQNILGSSLKVYKMDNCSKAIKYFFHKNMENRSEMVTSKQNAIEIGGPIIMEEKPTTRKMLFLQLSSWQRFSHAFVLIFLIKSNKLTDSVNYQNKALQRKNHWLWSRQKPRQTSLSYQHRVMKFGKICRFLVWQWS